MQAIVEKKRSGLARSFSAYLSALYFCASPAFAQSVGLDAGSQFPILYSRQAHSHACMTRELLAYGSDDLLPPTITETGAKVQPTVTPPGANDNSGHNGMGYGHHHHGQNNSQGYGQGYGPGPNSNPSFGQGGQGFGQGYGSGGSGAIGGGGIGWQGNQGGYNHHHRHQHHGQFGQNNQGSTQSASSISGIQNWNTKTQMSQSQSAASNSFSLNQSGSHPSSPQMTELERSYTQEAQLKINRIHEQTAEKRQAVQQQIALNKQQIVYGRGRHGYGGRGANNHNSSQPTAEQQRQLNEATAFERKSIESIQQALREKQRAIASAGVSAQGQLGAVKNDLHVHNYEITDTPSGGEIPLIATPKSLKPVH